MNQGSVLHHRSPLLRVATTCAILILLLSCSTSMNVTHLPSKNFSERVKFLVMHYTAINYQDSVEALVNEGGLSAHYLIPERYDSSYPNSKLKVLQLVDETNRAWHAGSSYWQGREDINDQSIGIEIVNVPDCGFDIASPQVEQKKGVDSRDCLFPDYDPQQIELLIELSKDILSRNPDIGPTQIVGHSDIAPQRKSDPGPRFPWYQLYKAGIGAWYENQTVKYFWRQFNQRLPSPKLVRQALHTYGYGIPINNLNDTTLQHTISAFQMHFLPWQVNGQADAYTTATLFALIEKYMPSDAAKLMRQYQSKQAIEIAQQPSDRYGQIDQVFPDQHRSSRKLVNDRQQFTAYQGTGELIINNINAKRADISVNGQRLNIDKVLQPYQRYTYSLAKRTQNGTNTLKVENVFPLDSQLHVTVPYPTLTNGSNAQKKLFAQVDALISADIDAGFPGAVLVVVKDGKIIKNTAYGYARKYYDDGRPLETPVRMTTNTIFDLASNTKMFATNLAIMKLVSENKLDINLPVQHYIEDYQRQGRENVLVRDLLTHTAGYQPEVRFFDKKNALGEAFYSQDKSQTEKLLTTAVPRPSGKASEPLYSDIDYMLLGVLVERITGRPLDDYVEREIYYPLGLRSTRFTPLKKGFARPQFAATEIHGNTRDGRIHFENVRRTVLQGEVHDEKAFYSSQGVAGHAGLFSSAGDLAILSQMLLNGGGYGQSHLIDAEVIDSFVKPEDSDQTFGLGWRRAGRGEQKWHFGPYASPLAYGHTGWTGTVTVIDPAYNMAIVLLTNARHSPIVSSKQDGLKFSGKNYEVGKFGSVVSLIYEALLNK